ncbi:hypothetical protein [Salinimicrobium sp. GXAS 041]|uniref:hypothetical protein n=1 Tax=Salinimicrobium sp. GXAS 041 TaxID=3400806 RepID=UPI003C7627A4
MTRKKPLYSTFSTVRYVKDSIFVLCLIYFMQGVLFGLDNEWNINQLALGIFLLIFLLIIDSKELIVYEDKLQVKRKHLFGLLSRKTDFELSRIKDISYSGQFSRTNDVIQDFLRLLLPVMDLKNTLTIVTQENETYEYEVHIYKHKLETLIKVIHERIPAM